MLAPGTVGGKGAAPGQPGGPSLGSAEGAGRRLGRQGSPGHRVQGACAGAEPDGRASEGHSGRPGGAVSNLPVRRKEALLRTSRSPCALVDRPEALEWGTASVGGGDAVWSTRRDMPASCGSQAASSTGPRLVSRRGRSRASPANPGRPNLTGRGQGDQEQRGKKAGQGHQRGSVSVEYSPKQVGCAAEPRSQASAARGGQRPRGRRHQGWGCCRHSGRREGTEANPRGPHGRGVGTMR
jgi:hypothetical protein